jgi:hypothetical protein
MSNYYGIQQYPYQQNPYQQNTSYIKIALGVFISSVIIISIILIIYYRDTLFGKDGFFNFLTQNKSTQKSTKSGKTAEVKELIQSDSVIYVPESTGGKDVRTSSATKIWNLNKKTANEIKKLSYKANILAGSITESAEQTRKTSYNDVNINLTNEQMESTNLLIEYFTDTSLEITEKNKIMKSSLDPVSDEIVSKANLSLADNIKEVKAASAVVADAIKHVFSTNAIELALSYHHPDQYDSDFLDQLDKMKVPQ